MASLTLMPKVQNHLNLPALRDSRVKINSSLIPGGIGHFLFVLVFFFQTLKRKGFPPWRCCEFLLKSHFTFFAAEPTFAWQQWFCTHVNSSICVCGEKVIAGMKIVSHFLSSKRFFFSPLPVLLL